MGGGPGGSTSESGDASATINVQSGASDFPVAAGTYATLYSGLEGARTARNAFSWIQRLALPAIQAAAQIGILQFQKNQYDDIEERRVGYLEDAVREWCRCINEDVLPRVREAADDVPAPAMYQPVQHDGQRLETISDNIESIPLSAEYTRQVNMNHREFDLARAVVLNPKYYEMNEVTWCSIDDLIRGELPVETTVETLTDTAENAAVTGRLGRSTGQARRNLGITSYRIQRAARQEQREERRSQNADVNPLSRHADMRQNDYTPQQTMAYALQQAQLLQNSLQNANNACARKAPFLQQELQIVIQKCVQSMQLEASRASLVNSRVPNFAGILTDQVDDLTSAIVGSFGSRSGSGGGEFNGISDSPASDGINSRGSAKSGLFGAGSPPPNDFA